MIEHREERRTTSAMNGNAIVPSTALSYLAEEHARLRTGGYWNCLTAARELARLLRAEGHRPWIARLRKTGEIEDHIGRQVYHAPLIPRVPGVRAAWTTHYVCCCEEMTYDPVAGRALPLERYSVEVFGEIIPLEVFAAAEALQE